MPETLLTPSSIKLFGRVLKDLSFNYDLTETVSIGSNNFLQQQLSTNLNPIIVTGTTGTTAMGYPIVTAVNTLNGLQPGMTVTAMSLGNQVFAQNTTIKNLGGGPGPGLSFTINNNPIQQVAGVTITATPLTPALARIYAFSFEGALYGMPRPAIFLVHGIGTILDMTQAKQGYRSTLDQSGVLAREWEFSAQKGNDMVYWEYEKGDFSIRLDTEAGPLEQILLVAALRAGADMADRSRSGMSVSGMSVSGMSMSGMSMSGMSVGGPGPRNGR